MGGCWGGDGGDDSSRPSSSRGAKPASRPSTPAPVAVEQVLQECQEWAERKEREEATKAEQRARDARLAEEWAQHFRGWRQQQTEISEGGPGAEQLRVLGCRRGDNRAKVAAAYRRLARELHPDKGGDAERFKKLAGAYEALMAKRSPPPAR